MTCIFLIMFSECSLLQSPLRMTQNLRPNASRLVFVIRVELEVLYVNFYIIFSSSKNWSKNISYLQINSYGLSITSASPKNVRIYLVKHKWEAKDDKKVHISSRYGLEFFFLCWKKLCFLKLLAIFFSLFWNLIQIYTVENYIYTIFTSIFKKRKRKILQT